ncbi:MAG: hypothetical protein Q8P59_07230 [Dehalococcoidia bacterium]|nr:hypothetical protein [Dehalococcoidia bacterium]
MKRARKESQVIKTTPQRSLYECSHAKVSGERITCYRGYRLDARTKDGGIGILRLERGAALEFSVCQDCTEFESMGDPVPQEERGWIHLYDKSGNYIAGEGPK